MAKKSKKKSFKQNWISYVPLLAAVLGVAAICFLFAPGMILEDDDKILRSVNGFQMMFGYSETNDVPFVGKVVTEYFEFSFLNLLTLIFLVGGVACAVLAFVKGNKLLAFVAAGCFVLAAVWLFSSVNFVSVYVSQEMKDVLSQAKIDEYIAETKDAYDLGWGSIVAAIVTILAAISSIFPAVFARFKK